ncbi:hypothetical protein Ahy_A02g007593 [Arachis hypogaea]|uniref:Isopenicillin N synthase-like Fe(2+) 2OG dioxygenase domain-containing protein n=1 Tax=Arachis hypogaea TaxID=3818 RepID=A0A445ED55_ARAHY|nr:hypothetical protein Ahy_A02g007593 [Arachis hypogaea]
MAQDLMVLVLESLDYLMEQWNPIWSNGKFHNVKHGVLSKETATRFTCGAFMLSQRDGNVDTPMELVDGHYRKFVANI